MTSPYITALLAEREHCDRYGKTARLEAIDAELDRAGVTRADTHDGPETAVTVPPETAVRRGRARREA